MVEFPTEVKVGHRKIPVYYQEQILMGELTEDDPDQPLDGWFRVDPISIKVRTSPGYNATQIASNLLHEMIHAYIYFYAVMCGSETVQLSEEGLVLTMEAIMVNLLMDNPDIARILADISQDTEE